MGLILLMYGVESWLIVRKRQYEYHLDTLNSSHKYAAPMQAKGKALHTTRSGGLFYLCNGVNLRNRNHADASTFGQRCVGIEYKRIVIGLGLTQGDDLVGAGYKDR